MDEIRKGFTEDDQMARAKSALKKKAAQCFPFGTWILEHFLLFVQIHVVEF